jgi:4-hydroxy-2-oxoheptanedioate aldolase
MPKRINKVIELFEQGQPVYCIYARDITFKGGKKLSKTFADMIRINMEHMSLDIAGINAFMEGLIAGGPTNSGHLTPTVIVELPIEGYCEDEIRMNAWMIKQILARGIHGILLCHAGSPEAVKLLVEYCRYPDQTIGVGEGLDLGCRGYGGEFFAAPFWGLSDLWEYHAKADVWPVNPLGELMIGLKIENKHILDKAEHITRVPGVSFAEWGPGDMMVSHGLIGYKPFYPYPEQVLPARARVMEACKASGLFFLDGVDESIVIDMINEGVMICVPKGSPEEMERAAEIGRTYTNRTMPV